MSKAYYCECKAYARTRPAGFPAEFQCPSRQIGVLGRSGCSQSKRPILSFAQSVPIGGGPTSGTSDISLARLPDTFNGRDQAAPVECLRLHQHIFSRPSQTRS